MLTLFTGAPSSGKTAALHERVADRLAAGGSCLLLVPEQQALYSERLLAERTESLGVATLSLEVLSFRRLANSIFRKYGGLCYHYADAGAQLLLLWQVFRAQKGSLRVYGSVDLDERSTIDAMLAEIRACKRAGITPDELQAAADARRAKKGEPDPVANKLSDVALLTAAYDELLARSFDDPEEDLTRACDLLERGGGEDFFAGKYVFLDGFFSLTGQELALLSQIISSVESVTVSLAARYCEERQFLSDKVGRFASALQRLAAGAGVDVKVEPFEESIGAPLPPALRFVEEHFGGPSPGDPPPARDVVRILSCPTQIEEVEALAAEILADVRAGGRFRDHIIAARDLDGYENLIESVFRRCGIPLFRSRRESLLSSGAVHTILAALEVIRSGYRCESVIDYIKTGYAAYASPLKDSDEGREVVCSSAIFRLEDYARMWNIKGRDAWTARPFRLHPDGYGAAEPETPIEAERVRARLARLTKTRDRLLSPLTPLADLFLKSSGENEVTVREAAGALYTFLDEGIHLRDSLRRESSGARSRGELAEAEVLAQLWSAICGALDAAVGAAGDLPCNVALFAQILRAVFSCESLGSIPTGVDEVLFSDALLLRGVDVRHAHLLGASEGDFPGTPSEDTILGDEGRRELYEFLGEGRTLPGSAQDKMTDEIHAFYRAITLPTERLTISYPRKDVTGAAKEPSLALLELTELLALEEERYEDTPPLERVIDRESLLALALRGGEGSASLYAYCKETEAADMPPREGEGARRAGISDLAGGICSGEDRVVLSEADLRALRTVSPSRLDLFASCPLSYTLQYVLRLREEATPNPGANHRGSVTHLVLERVLRDLSREGKIGRVVLPERETAQRVQKVLDEYRETVIGEGGGEVPPRLTQLLRRVGRTLVLTLTDIQEEFCASKFRPIAFELPVGEGRFASSGGGIPAPVFPDPAAGAGSVPPGGEVRLRGKIDRVDAYTSGGITYLRVVDYKTGAKSFSRANILRGFDLQMPLYLNALLREESACALGIEGSTAPAGFIYYRASVPSVKLEGGEDEEETLLKVKKGISRSGVVLFDSNREVLGASCPDLQRYPVSGVALSEDGTPKKGKDKALSPDEMLSLVKKETPAALLQSVARMRAGEASAAPRKHNNHLPCEYCRYKAVCRSRSLTMPLAEEESASFTDETDG